MVKPNYGMVHKTKKVILVFFRNHCKFQSRNIKFQSPVINLQDGVFNVKVIDIFCFKFLEKNCMKKKKCYHANIAIIIYNSNKKNRMRYFLGVPLFSEKKLRLSL